MRRHLPYTFLQVEGVLRGGSALSLSLPGHLSLVNGTVFHVVILGGTHYLADKEHGSATTLSCAQNNYSFLYSVHT